MGALRAAICREPDSGSTGFIVEVSLYSCTKSHSKQCTERRRAKAEHTLAKPSARRTPTASILTFHLVEGRT